MPKPNSLHLGSWFEEFDALHPEHSGAIMITTKEGDKIVAGLSEMADVVIDIDPPENEPRSAVINDYQVRHALLKLFVDQTEFDISFRRKLFSDYTTEIGCQEIVLTKCRIRHIKQININGAHPVHGYEIVSSLEEGECTISYFKNVGEGPLTEESEGV